MLTMFHTFWYFWVSLVHLVVHMLVHMFGDSCRPALQQSTTTTTTTTTETTTNTSCVASAGAGTSPGRARGESPGFGSRPRQGAKSHRGMGCLGSCRSLDRFVNTLGWSPTAFGVKTQAVCDCVDSEIPRSFVGGTEDSEKKKRGGQVFRRSGAKAQKKSDRLAGVITTRIIAAERREIAVPSDRDVADGPKQVVKLASSTPSPSGVADADLHIVFVPSAVPHENERPEYRGWEAEIL